MTAPAPVFEAPWHAQAFALAVHLHDLGWFDWPEWTSALSATLSKHGLAKTLDGGDDYFLAWLETLERMVTLAGQADAHELSRIKAAWEHAFRTTEHGKPVTL